MKELGARFAEVERRVRALVAENRELRGRLGEFEKALAQARQEAQEAQSLRSKTSRVQERLTRLLKALESIEVPEVIEEAKGSEQSS